MRFAIALALAALAAPLSAQQPPALPNPADVDIRVERLAPGVAVLFGLGGNIGVSYGEDGNVLIDDQFAPLTEKVLAALQTLDRAPVKFLINTHFHPDHTGGNENLGKLGAVIIAHEDVRTRLSTEQFNAFLKRRIPPSPKVALPVITFAQGLTLHFNGDDLQVIHVPHAHTDGDSIIYFRKGNVLHTGDIFVGGLPVIDHASGGTIDGMIAAGKLALSIVPEDVKIIRGHGPVGTKAELRAFVAMLEDVQSKVAAAKAAGKSLEEVQAMKLADAYARPGPMPAAIFIERVYLTIPGK